MPDIEYNSKDDYDCKQKTQTNDDIKQISFQQHYDIAENKGNKCRNYEIDNLKYRKKTGEFYYEMYWYYRSNGS